MVISILEIVIYKVSLTLILLLIITRNKAFKHILQKKEYSKSDLNKIGIVFGTLAIISVYCTINVYGAISATRNIIIISTILLFGRRSGIIALAMALIHRLSINLYTISIEVEILQLLIVSTIAIIVQRKIPKNRTALFGILISVVSIVFIIVYILIFCSDDSKLINFVKIYTMPILVSQVGIAAFIWVLQDIKKQRILLEQEAEIERLKADIAKSELKALQSQINPHFLFNTLNAISILTRKEPKEARVLIVKLSHYLRYNLKLKNGLINLYEEIEQVKVYLEIEKVRYKNKLDVIYDIDEGLNLKIPSLIIQPIVENAIIHGILKSDKKGILIISAKKESSSVRISIENKGIPIEQKIIDSINNGYMENERIGLYNVHSRLIHWYGKGLEILRLEDGTKVEFMVGGD